MMHSLFLAVAAGGMVYFLFGKRRFDLLTLAYISACAYFLPGFYGEVMYPLQGEHIAGIYIEILGETYAVMTLLLVTLLASALFLDYRKEEYVSRLGDRLNTDYVTEVVVLLGFLGFLMTLWTVGTDVLVSVDKNRILEELNRWALVWATGSTLGFAMAWQRKRWVLLAISAFMLVAEVYVGFRSSTAMALIALLCLWLSAQGPSRVLVKHWRVVLLGALVAETLFAYKFLFIAVKNGDFDYVLTNLVNPDFYAAVVLQSEPFVTQGILNEVISRSYSVESEHLLQAFGSLVIFAPELGLHIVGFNDLVQPDLFPHITESGIAANIWAQMFAAGGWTLLAIFTILFAAALVWGSGLLRAANPEIRATAAVFFAFFAFYIHRNDLLYQITLQKRVVLYAVLCFGIALILRSTLGRSTLKALKTVALGSGHHRHARGRASP